MFKTFDHLNCVYHVGTMDITKKSSFSLEWNHLSVSICPYVWQRIAKISGDLWRLQKKNTKFLDYYALTDDERQQILVWAINNGYAKDGIAYTVIIYDEDGNEHYSLYENEADAICEADGDDERYFQCHALFPTEALKALSLVKIDLSDMRSIITQLFADLVLDYDGVYWDETLDEVSYSAPRGCIFNRKVSTFNKTCIEREE